MSTLLKNVPSAECSADDILIHAKSKDESRKITNKVIKVIKKAGLKLHPEKCIFETTEIKFLQHAFSYKGLKIDEEKIQAFKPFDNLMSPATKNSFKDC